MSYTLQSASPTDVGPERRSEPRHDMERPAKVLCEMTGRYVPARTLNISTHGALVELEEGYTLKPGQDIALGIAWTTHHVMLRSEQLIRGKVIRSMLRDGDQHVAVSLEQRQLLAVSA